MQQGSNNRGPPRAQYGKVNHLEADIVQETPGVALGTFSVEYHSANVLFDTGATHYFVTASWVESHNIPVAPMYPPMRVSSVGGRTQTDRFCPSARIQIRGIEFLADLIVMGNQDTTIDVILGMNWLTKYQASLSCDKRTVKLVSPSGEEVLVELVLSGPRKGSCHQVTAHIEEIKPS
jgi:predicted aspartyl protease